MIAELQADYQSKLPALYDEQYHLGYWAGYAAGEGAVVQGNGSETPRDAPESLRPSVLAQPTEPPTVPVPSEIVNTSTDGGARASVLPSTPSEEARILLVPLGEGTSLAAEVSNSAPIAIILEETPAPSSNVS